MLEVGGGGGVASCAGQGREGAHRGFVAVEGEPPSDTGKDVAPVGVRTAPTGAEQDTTQDSEGQPKAKLEAGAEQGGGEVERRGTNVDRAWGAAGGGTWRKWWPRRVAAPAETRRSRPAAVTDGDARREARSRECALAMKSFSRTVF